LLDATACCEDPRSKLRPYVCRMLILLLYAPGLRIGEALSLGLTDVDLTAGVLTIRERPAPELRWCATQRKMSSAGCVPAPACSAMTEVVTSRDFMI
jgi:integrase